MTESPPIVPTEPVPDAGSAGAMLRAAREAAGLSIDALSQQLKLSPRQVKALDIEVCATLGMVDQAQAQALAEAGLTAYNHNLDTSEEHYDKIISTRTYDDRLKTLEEKLETILGKLDVIAKK